ncbi:hypothetical protein KG112_08165 [Nocardioides sp. zg-ZUI104]|uniref:hypothetical protein n=1 Tax=Nocardioides faecalis TaxID=2803858 RepID=UPI001BD03FB8|nr:hypothetical protein [Nocardioides faecalis]MBS4752781.1 hypothetical protein [Nocardioides faecalis]
MDPFNILFPARPDSRGTARALREMGIRAVIAEDGLQLISCGSRSREIDSRHTVGAKYHPRDHAGQFVDYWVLSLEIETDLSELDEHYPPNWLDDLPDID